MMLTNIADDDPPDPDPQNAEVGQPYWIQTLEEENHHHTKEGMSLCDLTAQFLGQWGIQESSLRQVREVTI
jgi:hypothetical protein